MLHPGRSDADEVAREDVRVEGSDLGADQRHVVVELELVGGGQRDPDAVADLRVLTGGHALHRAAELLGALLKHFDVAGVGHLVADLGQADAAFFEYDGVVVPLVLALVEHPARLATGLVQPHRRAVVLLRFFQIGDPGVDVPHT